MSYYLSVYVPRSDSAAVAQVDAGSGVVGYPLPDGRIAIHYEGNRYGAGNMQRLADRVAHAASRLRFGEETIAKAIVPSEALIEVGRYDGVAGRIEVAGEGAERELCRWLGIDQLGPDEFERSDVRVSPDAR